MDTLYTSRAPSGLRVDVYLAEKGLTDRVERVSVDLRGREHLEDRFAELNPTRTVPVLELEDGTCIGESIAICRYFEALEPEPPLFGTDAKDQALVEMWNRRIELDGLRQAFDVLRNRAPAFDDRALPGWAEGIPRIEALADRAEKVLARLLTWLDPPLSDHDFVAGDRFSVADITLWVTVRTATRIGLFGEDELEPPLRDWWERVSARPSVAGD